MDQILQLRDVFVDHSSITELCRRYGVKELALFGSAVRGEMSPESAVDIVVELEPGVRFGLIQFESLAEELELLAGRRVDLVTKRGLKPWVRPQALRDARVIHPVRYCKPSDAGGAERSREMSAATTCRYVPKFMP